MPTVGLERQPVRLPLDQPSASSCTRHSPRAGTRSRPSPSARRPGSRRRPASRGGSSPPARRARPISRWRAPGIRPGLPLVVLADVDQLDRPLPLQLGHPLGLDVHHADGTVRGAWSGSIGPAPSAATPARFVQPRTRAELAQAIVDGPGPVRVAGAGHSFSAGAVTEGTLISLDALDRVLDADAATGSSASRPASACTRSRASCTRAGWRCRTSATSTPSRSRARSPPARTAPARGFPNLSGQVEAVELVLADGSERTIDDGDELRAARVSLGALGRDRRGHAALRARVPAAQHRPAGAARATSSTQPAGARRRARPLRVLDLPARGRRAHAHARRAPTTRRPRARPRPRLHERRADGQPRLPRRQRGRAALPARDPAPEPLRVRGRLPARARRLVLPRSSPRSGSCASRRWSTRVPREHAVEAVRARHARRSSATRSASRSSCASAPPTTRCSRPRTAATVAFVAVHVFRAMAYEAAFREVEAALARARRAPALGQALVPERAPSSRRATRAGTTSRPSARELDPDGRFANAWVRDVLG